MATPRKLVETMAEVLGLPAATVTQYDRQLSESGLRSKSGRGPSAATVTARDAANLLIAMLGSPVAGASIKAAATTCAKYGALRQRSFPSSRLPFRRLGLPTLGSLPPGHSLIEALTTLIAAASRGETFSVPDRRERLVADFAFGFVVAGPQPWAEISGDGSLGSQRYSEMATFVYSPGDDKGAAARDSDLHQRRSVTFATIRKLAGIVADGTTQNGAPAGV
jgi:hypothetical protein